MYIYILYNIYIIIYRFIYSVYIYIDTLSNFKTRHEQVKPWRSKIQVGHGSSGSVTDLQGLDMIPEHVLSQHQWLGALVHLDPPFGGLDTG